MLCEVWADGETVMVYLDDGIQGEAGVSFLKPGDPFDWQVGIGIALLRLELGIREAMWPEDLAYFGLIEVDQDMLERCTFALRGFTDGHSLELMAMDCIEYKWIGEQ